MNDLIFVEIVMKNKILLKDKDVIKHLQDIKHNSKSDIAISIAEILLNSKTKSYEQRRTTTI